MEYIQTELILSLTLEVASDRGFSTRYDPAWDQPNPPHPSVREQISLLSLDSEQTEKSDFESDSEIYKPYNIPHLASPQSVATSAHSGDSSDLIGELADTQCDSNPSPSVREQVIFNTQQVAPEHSHWLETYWVARGLKKHLYYRYCWMVGRKIFRCHIPGGHIHSSRSIACCQVVREAIALNYTPQAIQNIIRGIRNEYGLCR